MKVYEGRCMYNFFILNYVGILFSTTKQENRKGVVFVPNEHAKVFKAVAKIYRNAKEVHENNGPISMILAEDKIKVKSRIAWEAKWDTLASFYRLWNNHICVTNYKSTIGFGEAGYNKVLESFRFDKVRGFARVIVVNLLHGELPRLVLVVCCTCNCFDSTLVRKQWLIVCADYKSLGGTCLKVS